MNFDKIATDIALSLLHNDANYENNLNKAINFLLDKYGVLDSKDRARMTKMIVNVITKMGYDIVSVEPIVFKKFTN